MIKPMLQDYLDQVAGAGSVPLRVRIPADLETPVSAFLKLKPLGAVFLLESVVQGIQVGRYSFIGLKPRSVLKLQNEVVTVARRRRGELSEQSEPVDPADPLAVLRRELARQPEFDDPDHPLPLPLGGAVGYLGYDLVRYYDDIPLPDSDPHDLPDWQFLLPSTLAVFDHVKSEIEIVTLPYGDDPQRGHARGCAEIERLLEALKAPLPAEVHRPLRMADEIAEPVLKANLEQSAFEDRVRRAKEHILAGDAFQIVLSQRLEGETDASPFRIYRALRILNPSPYLFFLDFEDFQLIGSSPEMLVRHRENLVQVNPIAGTRPRGETVAVDQALEEELLADEKEKAEHLMLVDLGRNDLGRVCRLGTVQVDDFMTVERYSHVMHLVSRVSGQLADDTDAYALLRATFPAGTVSGAPKIRAMQIVSDLEPDRRGPYAGCVGYLGRGGDMDMCIAIRTLVMRGRTYSAQAGAGIVADSDPAREYQETLDKIRAVVKAVAIAEGGA